MKHCVILTKRELKKKKNEKGANKRVMEVDIFGFFQSKCTKESVK